MLILLLSSIAPAIGYAGDPPPATIVPGKELVITDLSVVDSERARERGPWTFASLMRRIAPPGLAATTMNRRWLDSWRELKTLNGFDVLPRDTSILESFWPRGRDSELILDEAPFLLAAIVFRLDLDTPGKTAGEGRFIFGAFDHATGDALPLTVIFEFALPLDDELPSAKAWAKAIHALGSLPFGDRYNAALADLTGRFTGSLKQLRTNDFLFDFLWELREFHLESRGLIPAPLPQTPDMVFNDRRVDELSRWLSTTNEAVPVLPASFLAPAAAVPNEGFRWLLHSPLPEAKRTAFSLNTCNGCHSGETQTRFMHIASRRRGAEAQRSEFLTHDLERRAVLENQLLTSSSPPRRYRLVH